MLLLISLISCQRGLTRLETDQIKDGKYDSEYPRLPASEYLEELADAVKLVSILTFYESYDFKFESKITKENLSKEVIKNEAIVRYNFERPSTGSATVIYQLRNKVALLTCAHIINFPDTVFIYYEDEFGIKTKFIRNVSFKVRQNNNLIDLPQLRDFDVLAMNSDMDIALIGKDLETRGTHSINKVITRSSMDLIPLLKYPVGAAKELNWGSFVFLIGYPRAKKMISTAIVSSPNYDREYSFLIDASLQRGMSGGLVVAIRDGIPNFEIVGMTNAVSAETEYFLQPDRKYESSEWDINRPYTGNIYATSYKSIFYGITYAISIEKIQRFVEENKDVLKSKGYYSEYFFQY